MLNVNETEFMQNKIKELTQKVQALEEQIHQISAPIISSILPNTVLIPFVGDLYPKRFQTIISSILSYISDNETEWVILDFTAISVIETISLREMGEYIEHVTNSLRLMGTHVIIVGLGTHLTRECVEAKLSFINEVEFFLDFKTALNHLLRKKGYVLQQSFSSEI